MASRQRITKIFYSSVALLVVATILVSCSSNTTGAVVKTGSLPSEQSKVGVNWGVGVKGSPRCDPLGVIRCMLPFPSDYYTVPDGAMPSGRRVVFPLSAMPTNSLAAHVNPAAWERNDGFSPGSLILVYVPAVSLALSHIASSVTIQDSLQPNAPIVVMDADTGTRLAYWAELDANDPNPASQLLIIHPAANLPEGQRIVVALRNMYNFSAQLIKPAGVFASILAGKSTTAKSTADAAKRAFDAHIKSLLSFLALHGVGEAGMYLTWDFTVESSKNLTDWVLHMRNQAFSQLGSNLPSFSVTQVRNFTVTQNLDIARQITGTFNVPDYLNKPGAPPGSVFSFAKDGLPKQLHGAVVHASFSCSIPRSVVFNSTSAAASVAPGKPMLYGKGLFSLATQMYSEGVQGMVNKYGYIPCSTNWLGLDKNDELPDANVLTDLSKFPTIPDRLDQSLLDALFLSRLIVSPKGFDANPAFESSSGIHTPFIDTSQPLVYYGNSEGSLMGGALAAISPEFTRAVLGVPSMDYAILLNRSSDFAPFFVIIDHTYPDKATQQIIFDLLQMLWDRAETDGYAENITANFLPGTPPHKVLLEMAFGDHQVANVSTYTEARTLGARMYVPGLAPGRMPSNPFFGISPISSYPYSGNAALVVWDSGVPPPPLSNTPPTEGQDPHDTIPRAVPSAWDQIVTFLQTGQVINVCGNAPCRSGAPNSYPF
ncbi:MAG: hypothetical protein M1483_04025 [Actinobacteria bacterium]|nr:hypothetical protein [Actinomycetota bacterium]MCL6104787.1 hypothetical protein [Actinomycetota bacterium]